MTGTPNLTLSTARTNRELEAATEVLVSSFQNAPNFVAVFPNASARGRALPHPFRFVVRDAAAFGGTVLAMCGADVVGAAVWFPPKRAKLTFRRQLRALPDLARTFAAAPSSFVRFVRLGGTLEERKPREPHLYLAALGVAPAWQGRRVGTTLLRTGLAQADASGQRCSLETFSEQNVRFYERHGFVVTGSSDDPIPGGPPFWFMARPPEARVRAQAGVSPHFQSTGGPKYRKAPT